MGELREHTEGQSARTVMGHPVATGGFWLKKNRWLGVEQVLGCHLKCLFEGHDRGDLRDPDAPERGCDPQDRLLVRGIEDGHGRVPADEDIPVDHLHLLRELEFLPELDERLRVLRGPLEPQDKEHRFTSASHLISLLRQRAGRGNPGVPSPTDYRVRRLPASRSPIRVPPVLPFCLQF